MHFKIIPFDSSHLQGILSSYGVKGKQKTTYSVCIFLCMHVCRSTIFLSAETASKLKHLQSNFHLRSVSPDSTKTGACWDISSLIP